MGGPLPPLGIIAPAVLTGSPHNSPNSRLPTSPPGAHLSPVGPPRPPTPPMGRGGHLAGGRLDVDAAESARRLRRRWQPRRSVGRGAGRRS